MMFSYTIWIATFISLTVDVQKFRPNLRPIVCAQMRPAVLAKIQLFIQLRDGSVIYRSRFELDIAATCMYEL